MNLALSLRRARLAAAQEQRTDLRLRSRVGLNRRDRFHAADLFGAPVCLDAFCQDIARLDAVDRDAVAGEFDRRCLDEAADARLRRRVVAVAGGSSPLGR